MKLKLLSFILILAIGLLVSCSKAGENILSQEELLEGTWNLKNLSGGFAGLNENYSGGTITWTFNSQDHTIIVDNKEPASTRFISESGTYNYSIIELNNKKYLNIDKNEYGGLIISANSFTVDQNEISWGVGADGFVLYFEKLAD